MFLVSVGHQQFIEWFNVTLMYGLSIKHSILQLSCLLLSQYFLYLSRLIFLSDYWQLYIYLENIYVNPGWFVCVNCTCSLQCMVAVSGTSHKLLQVYLAVEQEKRSLCSTAEETPLQEEKLVHMGNVKWTYVQFKQKCHPKTLCIVSFFCGLWCLNIYDPLNMVYCKLFTKGYFLNWDHVVVHNLVNTKVNYVFFLQTGHFLRLISRSMKKAGNTFHNVNLFWYATILFIIFSFPNLPVWEFLSPHLKILIAIGEWTQM